MRRPVKPDSPVAILELGSHMISCLIGTYTSEGTWVLHGLGSHQSQGYHQGYVTHAGQLTQAILEAVSEAEGNTPIEEVFLVFDGLYLESIEAEASFPIPGQVVSEECVEKMMDSLPSLGGFVGVHTLPMAYQLDHYPPQTNPPLRMLGKHLRTRFHCMNAPLGPLSQVIAAIEAAHLQVKGVLCGGYTAAFSCLQEEERELGATVLDWGASTLTLTCFFQKQAVHHVCLPWGSDHITYRLAQEFHLSLAEAQRLKHAYGLNPRHEENVHAIQAHMLGQPLSQNSDIAFYAFLKVLQEELAHFCDQLDAHLSLYASSSYAPALRRLVWIGGGSQLIGLKWFLEERFPKKYMRFSDDPELILQKSESKTVNNKISHVLHGCFYLLYYESFNKFYLSYKKRNNFSFFSKIRAWLKQNL